MAKKKSKSRHGRRPPKVESREEVYPVLARYGAVQAREWLHLGVILFVALALRLTYFFINKGSNPLFYQPVLDALFHHDWALEILGGNFWGDEVFFRAPLYPYLLAFLYKISGSSMAFAVFVQHLLGTATVFLTYMLCREYFAHTAGIVAAALVALHWPLIYFEGELLIVTLIVTLDTLLLWLTALGLRRKWTRKMAIPGVIMGLSAIARPSILILAPALPFVMRWASRESWKRQLLAFALGGTVIVAPVIVRNAIIGNDFVPIASQGGVNFYIGNNPSSNGTQAEVPGARADLHGTWRGAIELAEADVGHRMKPSEVSNYYLRKGIDYFVRSPGDAISLTLRKTWLFWAGVERSNTKYIQFYWKKFGLGRIPLSGFWLVAPLALCGGALLWRRRRSLSLLYLFVITYMIGVVIFFINARFRLPVVPVLAVFAAYTLLWFWHAARSRASKLLPMLAVLVVCVAFVDYDFVRFRGVRSFDEAVSWYSLGDAYLRQGKKRSAQLAFEEANKVQQRYPTAGYAQIAGTVDYNLGVLYSEQGLASRAIDMFERIVPGDPAYLPSRYLIADLYVGRGQIQSAIRALSDILRAERNDATALLGLARIYRQIGDDDSYAAVLEQLRSAHPNDARVEAAIRQLEGAP